MFFSKAEVVKTVSLGLSQADQKRVSDINIAMIAALDELSLRLKSVGFLNFYEEDVPAGTRTLTLNGNSNDLRYIFALQIGSGESRRVLDYKEPREFIDLYDDPAAEVGLPERFTVLATTDGFPTVAFDRPVESVETLKTYYYCDITPENVAVAKSVAAVSIGTLAYFYGLGTDVGKGLHEEFKAMARLSREADDYTAKPTRPIPMNKEDRYIRAVINSIAQARRS
jgi:hypothetical protein